MITLIIGPMFSGKTTTLLSYESRFTIANKSVMVIKHSLDTRYSDSYVSTHNLSQSKNKAVSVSKLYDVPLKDLDNVDAILIDEGQFFEDLGPWLNDLMALYPVATKDVVIAGLSGDYELKPFKPILDVISKSDRIKHLVSICSRCGEDAPFSKRISNDEGQTVIGAVDKYLPRCRRCFHLQ